MKRLILSGDDFGLAAPVNEAIEIAHRQGVLSAASLMVGAAAAADALQRARRLPSLRVGLHLVLVDGRPSLPPRAIPDLVKEDGAFHDDLITCGFRFFLRPGIRRQLEREIRAQFEAFRDTGLPLDHVNAHNHMQLHPTVLGLILKVGRQFGMQAMRIPREPPLRSWRAARCGLAARLASAAALAPWTAWLKWRLRRRGIVTNDFVFGMNDSGRMTEGLLLALLGDLPPGTTEIYFHPASRGSPETDRAMPGYRHEAELAALLSPRVSERLRELDLQPSGYADPSFATQLEELPG